MSNPERSERLPRNYRIVLDVVREQSAGTHATTGDIFLQAKRRQPRIGHSTVYRALDRLSHLGLVSEVRVPGTASALYEPVRSDHAHFVCESCGRVDDVDCNLSPEQFGAADGARVTGISVTLHGVCAECRRDGSPGGA